MNELVICRKEDLEKIADCLREGESKLTLDQMMEESSNLIEQKESLVEALTEAGIEASSEETLSTLVPKANEKIREPDYMEQRVSGKFTSYVNDKVTCVEQYGLAYARQLKSVNLPNVTRVGQYAFTGCSALTTIELPSLEIMGTTYNSEKGWIDSRNIFSGCTALTHASFPELKTRGRNTNIGNLFDGCTALVSVGLPKLDRVGCYDFKGCSALTHVDVPEASSIANWGFSGSSVKTLYCPKVCDMGDNAFTSCPIAELELPSIKQLSGQRVFYSCKSLKTLSFTPGSDAIVNAHLSETFGNCIALTNVTMNCILKRYSAGSNLSFSSSPLTIESAKSIINALYDYSGTSEELAYSLTFSSSTRALLDAEGPTAPGDITWTDYATSKGWNI